MTVRAVRLALSTLNIARLLWVAIALTWGFPAQAADPSPVVRDEIQHLLAYLEGSGCQFFRNGEWHDAVEAKDHLNQKYNYLLQRDLVRTAEDFVRLGATKSSASGKPYQVRCNGTRPVPSALWLSDELSHFREQRQVRK